MLSTAHTNRHFNLLLVTVLAGCSASEDAADSDTDEADTATADPGAACTCYETDGVAGFPVACRAPQSDCGAHQSHDEDALSCTLGIDCPDYAEENAAFTACVLDLLTAGQPGEFRIEVNPPGNITPTRNFVLLDDGSLLDWRFDYLDLTIVAGPGLHRDPIDITGCVDLEDWMSQWDCVLATIDAAPSDQCTEEISWESLE